MSYSATAALALDAKIPPLFFDHLLGLVLGILFFKVGKKLRLFIKIVLADNSQTTQTNNEQANRTPGENSTNKVHSGAVFESPGQKCAAGGGLFG